MFGSEIGGQLPRARIIHMTLFLRDRDRGAPVLLRSVGRLGDDLFAQFKCVVI